MGEISEYVFTEEVELIDQLGSKVETNKEGGQILSWYLFGKTNYNKITFKEVLFLFNKRNWELNFEQFNLLI
jgi:hypothetical protein